MLQQASQGILCRVKSNGQLWILDPSSKTVGWLVHLREDEMGPFSLTWNTKLQTEHVNFQAYHGTIGDENQGACNCIRWWRCELPLDVHGPFSQVVFSRAKRYKGKRVEVECSRWDKKKVESRMWKKNIKYIAICRAPYLLWTRQPMIIDWASKCSILAFILSRYNYFIISPTHFTLRCPNPSIIE